MKIKAPKGTRDFYPDDMALRNWIAQRWREVSHRNGFVEYDGPIFEDLDLYRVKSGDEIVSQLFHFEDRGGRRMAIRPEMTPTLARMVAARASALSRPIKWFSQPRLCRAERPQRGRLREFFQWNVDILGEDGEIADAECIFVAADFFRDIGLSSDQVRIRINSRALVSALLGTAQVPDELTPALLAALDKRDKLSADAFAETIGVLRLTDRQRAFVIEMGDARGADGLARIERLLAASESGSSHCRRLRTTFELLEAMGVAPFCTYDMSVVRGLAYYTGIVFEAFSTGGLRRAICGGGRYDGLLSDLDGPPMGAVGFATSDVVIEDVLADFNRLPERSSGADFFVIDAAPSVFPHVLAVVAEFRARGHSALFSYSRQPIGKQFKQAAGQRTGRVLIVEPNFAETRVLSVKDMLTGRQACLGLDALLRDPFQEIGGPQ